MARKNFKDIDIYAGIQLAFSRRMVSSGSRRMASALTGVRPSRLTFSLFILKKTSKVWNTLTSQPVFLLISVVRTP